MSLFSMDSLNVPTSPQPFAVRGTETQLWEVVLVASCPIVFIIFLCLCVVCLVFRSYERPLTENVQRMRHSSSQIASILRQLPPPPKYDIAVTSVDAPPPIYTDVSKSINTPLRTTPNGARPIMVGRQFQNLHHMTTPTVQPLNIQYLYPPKYEETPCKVEHVVVEIDGRA